MATVRISKELYANILDNAKQIGQPAVDRAIETKPDWGDRLYHIVFGADLPLVDQLPSAWFDSTDSIGVTQVAGRTNVDFPLSKPRPWPHVSNKGQFSNAIATIHPYYTGRMDINSSAPQLSEFCAEMQQYAERIDAAKAKQTAYMDMVKKVITAYSTLAPALKAWPALWDLIPEEAKGRHREVVVREKKTITLDVDVNHMTAMTVAAKLGV